MRQLAHWHAAQLQHMKSVKLGPTCSYIVTVKEATMLRPCLQDHDSCDVLKLSAACRLKWPPSATQAAQYAVMVLRVLVPRQCKVACDVCTQYILHHTPTQPM